jgi:hypothetical protein
MKIVADNQHILQIQGLLLNRLPDCHPRTIHVRQRQKAPKLSLIQMALGHQGVCERTGLETDPLPFGHTANDEKSEIMPRVLVILSGIS